MDRLASCSSLTSWCQGKTTKLVGSSTNKSKLAIRDVLTSVVDGIKVVNQLARIEAKSYNLDHRTFSLDVSGNGYQTYLGCCHQFQ